MKNTLAFAVVLTFCAAWLSGICASVSAHDTSTLAMSVVFPPIGILHGLGLWAAAIG